MPVSVSPKYIRRMVILGLADNTIQLVPDGTLFVHIAIILVMIYVLNRTLYKPINRILAERERRTHGFSGEAHKILNRIDQSIAGYENTLRNARAEGYHLLEQQRAEAMSQRQLQLNRVREDIKHLVEEQKGAVEAQVSGARITLEEDARRIAREISLQFLSGARR